MENSQNPKKSLKLMPLLRFLGIALAIVAVFAVLIWIGEKQDQGSAPLSTIGNDISATDHIKGPDTAQLTLVEYADFQCPTCQAYAPLLDQLTPAYADDLRIVYRYFPLQSIHPNATIAAQAAEAAGLQGKFWEMHDILFARQSDWNTLKDPRDTFVSYAAELGINADQFKTDMDSKDVKNRVNDDYKSGLAAGVQGTPTFFLNGEAIENPRGLDAFKAVLDAKLQQ